MTIKLPSFPRELVGSDRLSLSLCFFLEEEDGEKRSSFFSQQLDRLEKRGWKVAKRFLSPLLSSPRRVSVYSFGEKKKGSRSIIILDTLDRVRQQAKRPGLS